MPLCYGGGIKTVEQAQRIFGLGVEKIALSSAAIKNPEIITKIAERVGSQSVVVVMDIKKKKIGSRYEVFIHNATKSTGKTPLELAKDIQMLGAGEIVINSIDRDGTMNGYDLKLIEKIRDVVSIPVTVMGGAGTYGDIGEVIRAQGIIGVAAGSLFDF
jgi:cyclase